MISYQANLSAECHHDPGIVHRIILRRGTDRGQTAEGEGDLLPPADRIGHRTGFRSGIGAEVIDHLSGGGVGDIHCAARRGEDGQVARGGEHAAREAGLGYGDAPHFRAIADPVG